MDLPGRHAEPQKGSVIVYLLVNQVSGKCYVGQTRYHTLSQRWSPSLKKAPNAHLAAAIRKYGPQAFKQTIVAHASCQEELNLMERFWIAFFQSADRRYGYNKTFGGQPCQQFTKEIRAVLSRSIKRWWRNLSAGERRMIRLRQSLARSGQTIKGHPPWNKGLRGIPSGRKGRTFGKQKNPRRHTEPFTEEHKRRISQALLRYHRQRRRKEKN